MIELLRAAAAAAPDHPAIVTPTRTVSYADLTHRAEAAAAALRARGIERFAVVEPDPAAMWALLAAGSLAGAEACIYPPAATGEVIAEFREKFGHDTLVSSVVDGAVPSDELFAAAEPFTGDVPDGPRPLLILTSGTSGPSKAAQHDWTRILRSTGKVTRTPEHRWLLAYGLNQFGGLQILLHVAAAGATLVAGESFRPRDGLAAMRRWDVTHTSGTPTFWRFLLAELRSDGGSVPALQQITLSGEAVPSALLSQLRERFPQAHLSQIFGATEMGQTITVRDGRAGLPVSFLVDSDSDDDDGSGEVVFKVVDGELWVRTESSMLGYFGQEPLQSDGWRATGDVVEIVGDRIEFRGRQTELINVGGVKVHPLPIEELVSHVDGVALAHAYGRPNPMVGAIVALDVVAHDGVDEDALRARIREACENLPPAARPRSIKFVETLDTPGNKLTRRARA